MTNQNSSDTFLRWWFQIFINFHPDPMGNLDDPIWLITAHISFKGGLWSGSFPPTMASLEIAWDKEISPRGNKNISPYGEPCQVTQGIDKWWLCFGHSKGPPGESVVLLMVFCWKLAKLSSWEFLVVYLPWFTRFYTSERWLFGISWPSTVVGLNILNSDFAKWVGWNIMMFCCFEMVKALDAAHWFWGFWILSAQMKCVSAFTVLIWHILTIRSYSAFHYILNNNL